RCDRKRTDPRVRRTLLPILRDGVVPVVTGFVGRTVSGETTTLGRSGSDTTAALLGEALSAKEVVIWTDDDGVLSADPRVFSTTARLGVSVVMFSQASSEQNIALVIPEGDRAGTEAALLSEFRFERLTGAIDSVTAKTPIAVVAAVGEGMRGTPGIAAKV